MENQLIENEVLEKKSNDDNKPKKSKKKIIMITAILVIFVALLTLAILVFKAPTKVSFNTGQLGLKLDVAVVDEDGKIKAPDNKLLEREHYIFLGWFKDADGTGAPLDLENMKFTESMVVYAIWDVIEYQITYIYGLDEDDENYTFEEYDSYYFEGNEENPNPSVYTVKHDKVTKSDNARLKDKTLPIGFDVNSYILESGLRLVKPVKEGYTFVEWQIIDKNGEIVRGLNVKDIRTEPKGDITLRAIWR